METDLIGLIAAASTLLSGFALWRMRRHDDAQMRTGSGTFETKALVPGGGRQPADAPGPPPCARLLRYIEGEEGRSACAYTDSRGFLTIGVGLLIDRRVHDAGLREHEMDWLLAGRLNACASAMEDWPAWKAVLGDAVREAVLIGMCFQLGAAGLAKFHDTLAWIARRDWEAAARQGLESAWAKQTPARAQRAMEMMRTGRWPEPVR